MVKRKIIGDSRTGTATTTETSEERIKKMFDSYANSELFEHDFDKMKPTERIKFVQEMAPYFLKKPKFENVEIYDVVERDLEKYKQFYGDYYDKWLSNKKVYRGPIEDIAIYNPHEII